jgi:hypothetical protein
MIGAPTLQVRPSNPDFLDLRWELPVDEWTGDRMATMPVGIHRHPVVFVAYDEGIYAIKEMSLRLAVNEYRVLRRLTGFTQRAAEPVALAERHWLDPHDEGAGVVITRYVEHSFPYRRLVSGAGFGVRRNQMLDALAGLLVELHMAGCYWGDCSLSNVLYRFDAGQIEAIMIDAETSEIHNVLSDGQRLEDIEIMKENVAGEMGDIAAEMGEDIEAADIGLGWDVESRYHGLWSELNEELVITRDDHYRIRQRIGRIAELGFAVDDLEMTPVDGGNRVRLITRVGGRTYNSDNLRQRTGIEASENQAKLILSDLNYFLSKHGDLTTTRKSVGTFKWLSGQFEPMVERIGEEWFGEDPIQGYCDYLNFRMALATERQADVDAWEAFEAWMERGFPGFDPNRT